MRMERETGFQKSGLKKHMIRNTFHSRSMAMAADPILCSFIFQKCIVIDQTFNSSSPTLKLKLRAES